MVRIYSFIFLCVLLVACQSAPTSPSYVLEPSETSPGTSDIPEDDSIPITLSFAGDTMMAGKVADIVKEEGVDYPFTDAAPIFRASDLAMLNLETAISLRAGTDIEKQYTFQSDPSMAEALNRAGVTLVTIANNHALDFGREAFLDTIDYLSKAGIQYVGGGANQTEAYASKTFQIKEKRLQFFGFSRVFPEANWHAGHNHPGMASAYDTELVYQRVEAAIDHSDFTIVYVHWGKELADEPLPYQIELARGLIDIGVDLVIGSHPHVLQGLEWYKGKLIVYSLGNFVFTTSLVEEARQTAILQIILQDEKLIPRVIPMYIDRGAVWLANEEQHQAIMDRLQRLSIGGVWIDEVFKPIE